jgi:hypothetical protein
LSRYLKNISLPGKYPAERRRPIIVLFYFLTFRGPAIPRRGIRSNSALSGIAAVLHPPPPPPPLETDVLVDVVEDAGSAIKS